MSLYESNYIRLRALVGDPALLRESRRSIVAGDCDLVLDVLEQARYTATLQLTYILHTSSPVAERYPDLHLRVYCDARLAEAQFHALETAAAGAPPGLGTPRRTADRELEQRWAVNMMLNKWLEYCGERGHRFI